MYGTFWECTSLTTAPEIQKGVVNMQYTFKGCTSLITVTTIPDSVTNMYATFQNCTSLIIAPEIPNSVTNMYATFIKCTSLTTVSTIPNSVTVLVSTFSGCSSLQGNIEINANVTGKQLGEEFFNNVDYYHCLFETTTNLGITLKVTGTCPVLQEIVDDANNPNISLK